MNKKLSGFLALVTHYKYLIFMQHSKYSPVDSWQLPFGYSSKMNIKDIFRPALVEKFCLEFHAQILLEREIKTN
ncbi:hypothetical protein [Vibrio harveyi]|uniref:hypothetical protein n=1 Tax=Vibrio harveyi TaxID=669 RepID=UPI002380788C|nr:hypothetical protein [Vibrio harveyi]